MRITMQYKMFLIKYAEIGTKGKNRYVFEEICASVCVHA